MPAVLEVFAVPPFQENTYLFGDTDAGEAAVIDAGGRVAEVLAAAQRHGVRVTSLLNTHAHIDHVLGIAEMIDLTGATFLIHPEAARMLPGVPDQARMMGLPVPAVPVPDGELVPGTDVYVGGLQLRVRYTPGHAPGHITLVGEAITFADGPSTIAFCGDVIFAGSIGRTDLAGGDYELLMTSIQEQILTLPPDTTLLSGHGPPTTVAHEAATNPFVLQWLSGARP